LRKDESALISLTSRKSIEDSAQWIGVKELYLCSKNSPCHLIVKTLGRLDHEVETDESTAEERVIVKGISIFQ